MAEYNGRNLRAPEFPSREYAAVASDEVSVRTNENRVVEAELGYARRNLGDLRIGMQTSVPSIRDEALDGPGLKEEILRVRDLAIDLLHISPVANSAVQR